jgi:glutamate-1-semialdehyde 2,1-aminomutase
VLRQDDVYEGIKSKGSRLRHGLKTILDNEEIPAQICGDDMIFDVYFSDIPITTYRSTMSSDKVMMNKFNAMLLEEGVLKGWPQKFYPSLAHSDSDITETISAFERVIQRLKT